MLLRGEDARTAWHDERREKAMQSVSVSGEPEAGAFDLRAVYPRPFA